MQILAEDYCDLCSRTGDIEFRQLRRGYLGMLLDLIREWWSGSLRRRLAELEPDFVLFYNLSPLNLLLAARRTGLAPRFGIVLHDPWKDQKFGHGLVFAIVYSFVEWLQQRIVQRCDHIITLSEYGTHLVERRYPQSASRVTEGRILLAKGNAPVAVKRNVVSIVGRINPSTGHATFLKYAAELRPLLPGVEFEVVSSSPTAVASDFATQAADAAVRVEYRPLLTEVEIESAIARSICVFRLDEELTQSGVLPLCYRLGTPVIARAIPGLVQHVLEGRTGYLVHPDTSAAELANWISNIQSQSEYFYSECRTAFMGNWSEEAFDRYYGVLRRSLEKDA